MMLDRNVVISKYFSNQAKFADTSCLECLSTHE